MQLSNITIFKENIRAYTDVLNMSLGDELASEIKGLIKHAINNSNEFIASGENEFGALGYFYFEKQKWSKKDLIYILFRYEYKRQCENECDVNCYLGLGAKIKNLGNNPMVKLCETKLDFDFLKNPLEKFEPLISKMLRACELNYKVERKNG